MIIYLWYWHIDKYWIWAYLNEENNNWLQTKLLQPMQFNLWCWMKDVHEEINEFSFKMHRNWNEKCIAVKDIEKKKHKNINIMYKNIHI